MEVIFEDYTNAIDELPSLIETEVDKYFVLASNVSESNDANTDNIIFALKENCLY